MVGESAGVDSTVVEDWKEKLPHITAGYAPEDIYNMDESGLFYRTTTNKTLATKGQQCSGGKQAKDRLTLVLCANMAGGKEKPLIIGKSENPRCFKNIDRPSLPVTYTNNAKAWMTSDLFKNWLKKLDQKMGRQGRKILLLLDNAPSHPDVALNHIELKFFPPNTTSRLQPMDQGIIQTVKLKYRKRQLRRILQELENDKEATGTQAAKRLTVLQAIQFVGAAWRETTPETIQKCFRKAGFNETPADTETESASTEPSGDAGMEQLAQDLFGCNFADLAEIDQDLATCETEARDWDKDATVLLQELQETGDQEESDEEDEVEASPSKVPNLNSLVSLMKDIKILCAEEGLGELLNVFDQADDMLSNVWNQRRLAGKQTTIEQFFKSK
ncbi:tigger transposable element-derived protein 4-like [Branchiostoma floridae]|uniref:Tigger transposable element-derived protein 4-like n=1 Tax=Branchiostoma floridae TaxID=7739 RepID=A0A9J7MMU3_BRAFL|nr:tigger transposable element-derived protein 4-like [Branchiostoma floridae]